MSPRRMLAALTTAVALIAGLALAGTASAEPGQARSVRLQQRVDAYLAAHPEARRIAPNEIAIPGGSLTFAAPGRESAASALACSNGHLCIQDGTGATYDYYHCGYYSFAGVGDGTFNNNQTSGTVAKFYNSDGSLRWSNTAKDTGTASWTPVYYIRPC
ncbi:hypothetical protein [Streptomyces sp. SID8352]|uniref:hypothetical protein n=1 Tax=Streptomyces sp. SID8352 TaxID=2690338 RepID=UPI00136D315C|nr:hypothetical protein [Streptomyces sp. SID8352]MYU20509.1 hypothetical protein [Streptomyces sp. SID8352]